ncbi:MAG: class I SAM-dependent methyltransferase [Betaproteobacteria bacterium]
MKRLSTRIAAAAALAAFAVAAQAQPKTRADCERDYKPSVGQTGKDVVWVPTPDELIARMLRMAKVTDKDYVIDLGAGDGKIAIAAAKNYGATSLGIEYNPDMVKLAQCMVQVEGVGNKTKVVQGDIFKEDFSKATVLTMYLLPELNLCVRHRVLAMKPGTRVASHQFTMGEWQADEQADIDYRNAYLWIVPARVGGTWVLREANGTTTAVALTQDFQKIGGAGVTNATLRGEELKFTHTDAKGATRAFTGKVSGKQMTGTLRTGSGEAPATATLQGEAAAAPWAAMAPSCARFYGG